MTTSTNLKIIEFSGEQGEWQEWKRLFTSYLRLGHKSVAEFLAIVNESIESKETKLDVDVERKYKQARG